MTYTLPEWGTVVSIGYPRVRFCNDLSHLLRHECYIAISLQLP